jgi:arginyl-tRNA synthetase
MKLLGESVRVRYLQELGREATLPEDGYQGEYIREIARSLIDQHREGLADTTDLEVFRSAAVDTIMGEIRQSCAGLGVRFDNFTNERDLMNPQAGESVSRVDAVLDELRKRDLLAEYDGAIWLRGEPLGLPKDAVLVRSGPDREPTYRTPDIAYHIDKLKRGFEFIIDVFGADHIAEHQQVIAAVKALGYDVAPIRAIIYQFVTLTRAGERVKMSTRKATYVTLDELVEEVGKDVVRFFFLFRKHDRHPRIRCSTCNTRTRACRVCFARRRRRDW